MDEKRERRWIPGEKADYVKELVEIINQEERDDQLAEKLSAYHENDIAEAFELLDEKGRRKLYRVLDTEWMSEVFAYLDDVGTYLEELEADDAADIIENMDADDAVDVLQEVDDNVREKLVSLMNEEATEDIELICSYQEDQIGSMMTTNFIEISRTLTIKQAMRQLIGHAHVITPNLTEAAFLLDEPYRPDISPDGLKEQLRRLAAMGPDRVVITSAPAARPGHCAAVAYDREQGRFWKMESPYIPAFYPGTGDTFSSVLVGAFLQGDSLPVALERAVRFVTLGIRVTYGYDTRHSDGVLLERTLPALQDRCAIGEYEAF